MKRDSVPRLSPLRTFAVCCGGFLWTLSGAAHGVEAPPPPVAEAPAGGSASQDAAAEESAVEADEVAAHFLTSCSGCHTLTDVKLTGPGLATSMTWPDEQLQAAVKRMEEKVGPLKDEDVVALAAFIKDAEASARLAAEQKRMQARLLSKMEPPDPALGARLFSGEKALKNGGLACAACHEAAGMGGNLGPDLSGVFRKMGGRPPLVSAIEKANYPIMEPHYARHPVTTQEALHLAEFLALLDPDAPAAAEPSFARAGAGLAGVLLAFTTILLHSARTKRGRDSRLVRRRK